MAPGTFHEDQLIEPIYVAVVTAGEGGAVVLTWRRDMPVLARFIDAVKRMSHGVLPGILVQLMFAYIENTYFSATWWQSLNEEQRRQVGRLAHIEPYYTPFEYMEDFSVPWQIVAVCERWTDQPA